MMRYTPVCHLIARREVKGSQRPEESEEGTRERCGCVQTHDEAEFERLVDFNTGLM
jgi:hypothetical protein